MVRSILFTIGLAIVFFIVEQYTDAGWLHSSWKIILLFFLTLSYLIHRLMELGFENDRENFVPFYMGTIIMKLVLSLVFVGVFLYRRVPDKKVFIVDFLALYMIYTGFEIYGLSRNLRRNL